LRNIALIGFFLFK